MGRFGLTCRGVVHNDSATPNGAGTVTALRMWQTPYSSAKSQAIHGSRDSETEALASLRELVALRTNPRLGFDQNCGAVILLMI